MSLKLYRNLSFWAVLWLLAIMPAKSWGSSGNVNQELYQLSSKIIDNNVQMQVIKTYISNISNNYKAKLKRLVDKRELFLGSVGTLYKMKIKPKELLLVRKITKEQMLVSFAALNYWVHDAVDNFHQTYLEVESIKESIQELNKASAKLLKVNKDLIKYKSQLDTLVKKNRIKNLNIKQLTDLRTKLKYNALVSNQSKILFDKVTKPVFNQQDQSANTEFIKNNKNKMILPSKGYIFSDYHSGDLLSSSLTYYGIVMIAQAGSKIVAPADGEIIFSSYIDKYSQVVFIKHSPSFISIISGDFKVTAKLAQKVKKGEPFAIVGNATKPIYFELDQDSNPIDPYGWLANYKPKGKS